MSGAARRAVARLAPPALKRARQGFADARFARLVEPPTRAYIACHGLTVSAGPFAGMRYLEGVEAWSHDLVAKLSGLYELELHPALSAWIAACPDHVVDVGCAEGYYAVGLALAMPAATVHAFDVDPDALARCERLARHNGVADRVRLAGECSPAALERLPAHGVALLCDCEGCERGLLNPQAAPRLRGWPVIAELHEFLDAAITRDVTARFAATHAVELVDPSPRDAAAVPGLAGYPPRAQAALVSERRPPGMRWAVMAPRGRP